MTSVDIAHTRLISFTRKQTTNAGLLTEVQEDFNYVRPNLKTKKLVPINFNKHSYLIWENHIQCNFWLYMSNSRSSVIKTKSAQDRTNRRTDKY